MTFDCAAFQTSPLKYSNDARSVNVTMSRLLLLTLLMACGPMTSIGWTDDVESGQPAGKVTAVVSLLELVLNADEQTARECLSVLTRAVQNGQVSPRQIEAVRSQLSQPFAKILSDETHSLRQPVALLAAGWNDPQGVMIAQQMFGDSTVDQLQRVAALNALIASDAEHLVQSVAGVISGRQAPKDFRISVIEGLGGAKDPEMARFLIDNYPSWEADVRPRAIEVLTQRPEWSTELLKSIKAEEIDKDALNFNQLKRLALFKNDELQGLLAETYGAIRQDRRSDRQQVINFHRDFLNGTPGDPERGIAAYNKVCGQCHKIYGEGAEVGPDITRNGRNDWEQLLQNVFDPSAVIGPGYQARTLVTLDGRVLTGLPVEESDQRVVLKIQGGKTETIPRDQIEAYAVSEMSMMPEDLEKQLTPQEIADLFAFLALDKHPSDPTGKLLPGAPQPKSR
jgi:putative heme-binding domain-containing protein